MRRCRGFDVLLVGAVFLLVACGSSGNNAGVDANEIVPAENGVVHRITYGTEAANFGELTLPDGDAAAPVVVLIHGGFWRSGFDLDLMRPLVPSLVDAGFAVWNIEYRTVGAGGGYPQTFDDTAAAIDHLARLAPSFARRVDLGRVTTVGHSAGGHLAVWVASRDSLQAQVPGASPAVQPVFAVSQAGVLDLAACIEAGTGGTACSDVVGATPATSPELFSQTSPIEMIPTEASVLLIHGTADSNVPIDQSTRYLRAANDAGMTVELISFEDADHFDVIDPSHESWVAVLAALI